MNPFEYHGLFVFKDDDGDYTAIHTDNIQDTIGEREEPNEEAVWFKFLWLDIDDLREERAEILGNSGLDFNMVHAPSVNTETWEPVDMTDEQFDILLIQEAVSSGRVNDPGDTCSNFKAAAERILAEAPDDEKLQAELAEYLEPPGINLETSLHNLTIELRYNIRPLIAHMESVHESEIKEISRLDLSDWAGFEYRISRSSVQISDEELREYIDED